ncbi:MAG TPA: hypothetical protein VGI75_06915, partial [Pirellulales bacterium]
MTAGASFAAGILTVTGTTGNDTILVSLTKDSKSAQVTLNGQIQTISGSSTPKSVLLTSLTSVTIIADAGNDIVTVNNIDRPVTANGDNPMMPDPTDVNNRFVVVGRTSANVFDLPAAGSDTMFTVNSKTYNYNNFNFLGLYGQAGADALNAHSVPILDGTNPEVLFDGGAGSDKIVGPDTDNIWNIVLVNGGNLVPQPAGSQGTLTFGNTESLTGGSGNDTFIYKAQGSLGANIDGGSGTNSVDFSAVTRPMTFVLRSTTGTGPVGYGTGLGGLSNVPTIIGGTGVADTLFGPNLPETWNIAGINSGTIGAINYSGFESLTGGSKVDTFDFTAAGGVTGKIDGGASTDELNLSASGNGSINLQTKVFSTTASSSQVTTAGLVNVEKLDGSASAMTATDLIGLNANTTWSITGTDTGKVGAITFQSMKNLTGGTKNDTFAFVTAAKISGGIDGGAGTNVIDYSHTNSTNSIDLDTFINLQKYLGGTGDDTIIGDDNSDTFNLTANNAGNVQLPTTDAAGNATTATLTFTAVENLQGGSGSDVFVMTPGKTLSGTINGGMNSVGNFDELDYSAYTMAVMVDLSAGSATNVHSLMAGAVTNIEDIAGGSGND